MSLPIPEDHAEYFRQKFAIGENDPLPPQVIAAYWRTKRLADSSSVFLDIRDLMWIALGCGFPLPADAYSFLKVIEEHNIEWGRMVQTKWRNRHVTGVYQGVSGNHKIIVQLEGSDPTPREFEPSTVTLYELPTRETALAEAN